jgi:uncharacterized damage-inducible protein DinB
MEEAWLSGPLENVSPTLMPAAHALVQAARDIEEATSKLNVEEIWAKPNGAPSVGFHLLHVAGSIDRLLTYASGEKLSSEQFVELSTETAIDKSLNIDALLPKTLERIEKALAIIRETPPEVLFKKRTVGRKNLPTNVFGLLFHIAEHTQRHTGQIVTTAKIICNNK